MLVKALLNDVLAAARDLLCKIRHIAFEIKRNVKIR